MPIDQNHVKHARMTDQFLSKLAPCANGRGYTVVNAKINVVFRFPNGMINSGEITVIDLCREGGADGHPITIVCYLRKPKWIGMLQPRYDMELWLPQDARQIGIDLPADKSNRPKFCNDGIRWYHTINPQQDRLYPILVLRENENHVSKKQMEV